MEQINNHKIIFTGPVGAGKTTAISSISDMPIVSTDEAATDMTKSRKPKTTVAMDYGIMKLDDRERIHLYGTPGQERFDFMWDILSEGGIGLVLLVNNSRPDPYKDMHFFLEAFGKFIDKTQVVIGVTRVDESPAPTVADYHQQLPDHLKKIPIFEVDARKRRDISLLVQALLYSLDPGMVIQND
ncbi:MAG: ATP/GTP-binding protein [Chromatiales bacterium]|nr:ATP/GTP-binding protein [Chromatiales bacterium]